MGAGPRAVGIVGHEEAKFTALGRDRAIAKIRELLSRDGVEQVVSGACHLGGIDIWAMEVGEELGLVRTEYPPARLTWIGGYKERNMQIADRADVVYSLVVNELPKDFKGMRFDLCYHCLTKDHVKSGGCWTAHYAKRQGKPGHIIIIPNF